MKSRVYFDYLDALRFFAFMAVFIAHAGILFPVSADWFYWLYRHVLSNGAYGVNFFFVLSGFLITFLLLKEKRETHTVDIKFFYLKRILRIWPVYFVVFFVSIFILPMLVRALGAEHVTGTGETFVNLGMTTGTLSMWTFAFFLGNFAQAFQLGAIPFALGVLWSVSVEEQFYLVWPVVVRIFKEKALLYVSLILFFASLIYKAVHINDANIAYYSTLSVGMDLAFGSALGIYYFLYQPQIRQLAIKIKEIIVAIKARQIRGGFVLLKSIPGLFQSSHTINNKIQNKSEKSQMSKTDRKKLRQSSRHGRKIASLFSVSSMAIIILTFTSVGIWAWNVVYLADHGYGLVYDTLRLMKRPVLDTLFVVLLSLFVLKGIRKGQRVSNLSTSDPMVQMDISAVTAGLQPMPQIGFRHKPFTYLGRISYGLYAYHTIAIVLILGIFTYFGITPNTVTIPIFMAIFVISFVLTVFMAHISYVYMEQKTISLRSYFKKQRATD